jgi:type I restriction enzyme S subunit
MATSQDFVNWACSNQLLPRFLQYLLIAEGKDLLRFASGSVHPTIYFPEVKAFHICHPPAAVQHRVVEILDQAFEAIAIAKTNADRNLQNASALFETSLRSIFAEASERFEIVPLSEIAKEISDGDHLPPPKSQTGIPFITIGDIQKETRTIDFSDTFTVPQTYYDALKPNRKPRKADVLYTVTGSFGIPVLVETDIEFCFQRHIALVRPKETILSRWLFYLLMSPQTFAQANERATGTAQRTVSLKVLRTLGVPKVPLEHQTMVAARLDSISSKVQQLEAIYRQKLAALDELKKSLLHQAFTGNL